MLTVNKWTEPRVPDGGVEERTQGTEGLCSLTEWNNSVNKPESPGAPGDWTTNQRMHMEGPIAPVTYVAEDGLLDISGRSSPWA